MRIVMTELVRVLFVLTLLLGRSRGSCQTEPSRAEVCLYTFKYVGLTVAHGAITISDTIGDDDQPARQIDARATSLPATSFLFMIKNRYTTVVDSHTGYPLLYEKDIEQSNLCEKVITRFNEEGRMARCGDGEEIDLSLPTHTFFSALLHMIRRTFQPREVVRLPVYAAGLVWEARAEAVRAEKLVTPAGTYQTVCVEVSFERSAPLNRREKSTDVLTNRLIREGAKTYLWFSTGHRRILVKAEYELFPSRLHMILNEHHR